MATIDAIEKLMTDVQAYFQDQGVTAAVSYGFKERTKRTNQGPGGANRVVFEEDTKPGKIVGVHQPGDRPIGTPRTQTVRALRNWERPLIVSIWAADAATPNSEIAQTKAVLDLFESTMQAVQGSSFANAVWGETNWTKDPVEVSFGRELRVGLVIRHPLFDAPKTVVYPALAAAFPTPRTIEPAG